MNINIRQPEWVTKSLNYLKTIRQKLAQIRRSGYEEIRRGLEKTKRADELQIEAEYLEKILSQKHDENSWSDEIISIDGLWLENRLHEYDNSLSEIVEITQYSREMGDQQHQYLVSALSATSGSGGTAIYLGANLEMRFHALEYNYKPFVMDINPHRITSREVLFQELKLELSKFGEEYVSMLEGSEVALDTTNPDSLSQATHSMRDCFEQLIKQLAPSGVVKSQPWYKSTKGAPGGISRRSRLRYLLYGSGENIDEIRIQKLDELANIAKECLDLCIARAHDHDLSLIPEEVKNTIDIARNALLIVIREYHKFRDRNNE